LPSLSPFAFRLSPFALPAYTAVSLLPIAV